MHSVTHAYLGKHGWVDSMKMAIHFTTQQTRDIDTPSEAEWIMIKGSTA